MVGPELQFLTPFPDESLDCDENLESLESSACRNMVFRLRETLTFQKWTTKVLATLRWFAWEVPRDLFFPIETEG